MLSERNYCRDEVLGCILFKVIVLPTLETVRDICWLANLPEISNVVRMATAKVDQGGNKSNNVCSLPSQISKTSDRSSQNSTHRNLLRLLIYLTWKIQVQMPGQKLPRAAKALKDRSLLLHIRTNPDFIARKWYYHSIQRPSMCKT